MVTDCVINEFMTYKQGLFFFSLRFSPFLIFFLGNSACYEVAPFSKVISSYAEVINIQATLMSNMEELELLIRQARGYFQQMLTVLKQLDPTFQY